MRSTHATWILLRHFYRVWRGGQIRFRLETFGVYYPAFPYSSPWWKVSPRVVVLLIRRLPPYVRWVREMEDVAAGGAAAWWSRFRQETQ